MKILRRFWNIYVNKEFCDDYFAMPFYVRCKLNSYKLTLSSGLDFTTRQNNQMSNINML